MSNGESTGIAEHESAFDFERTIERLEQVLTEHGMTIFGRVDHAAGARAVGLSMLPATVLTYGNPKGGTPIMTAAPLAALDLPLRVLVRQREDGKTAIAFHPIAEQLVQAGVVPAVAAALEPAQHLLLVAIAA
jgi:uncharacterized protein (DUF302 family)